MTKKLLIGITVLLASCNTNVDMVEQQVDELYAKMTQKERIAQLRSMYMDDLFDEQGNLDTMKCRELIPDGIGHFSPGSSITPPTVFQPCFMRKCSQV